MGELVTWLRLRQLRVTWARPEPGASRSAGLRMRGGQVAARAPVIQFTNCRILRGGALLRWARVRAGGRGRVRAGGRGQAPGPATRAPARSVCREDLWVRGGRILDPEKLFFEERRVADEQRDCGGCILAPGFIDVQINGAARARGAETPKGSSEPWATPSFLWPQVDLALTSHRPRRTWVRGLP